MNSQDHSLDLAVIYREYVERVGVIFRLWDGKTHYGSFLINKLLVPTSRASDLRLNHSSKQMVHDDLFLLALFAASVLFWLVGKDLLQKSIKQEAEELLCIMLVVATKHFHVDVNYLF